MSRPQALVVRAPGTNRDGDVTLALELAGADVRRALINELFDDPKALRDSQLLVVPGGFSFADALGAGRLFALELVTRLRDELTTFVEAGKPVIGICNGFQVLIRTGLLPGDGHAVALGHNASPDGDGRGSFRCDWVRLAPASRRCVWTAPLREPIDCPIAHGEGRFVCSDDTLAALQANDQIALRYAPQASTSSAFNPNGSMDDVAGICDSTGLVLGLMPHPENHVLARQHPRATRGHRGGLGSALFAAGVSHVQEG